jgi:hypothetical protein
VNLDLRIQSPSEGWSLNVARKPGVGHGHELRFRVCLVTNPTETRRAVEELPPQFHFMARLPSYFAKPCNSAESVTSLTVGGEILAKTPLLKESAVILQSHVSH